MGDLGSGGLRDDGIILPNTLDSLLCSSSSDVN